MIIGNGSNKNKNNSIKTNFSIKQNNTFIHEFDIYYIDTDGLEKAYDFTDCYLQFYIKSTYNSFIKRVGTVSVIDNTVRLYIADSELDFYGKYKYELVVTTASNQTSTLVEGEINIERSVVITLQEVLKEITLGFQSFFAIIPINYIFNKFNMAFVSFYNIILNLDKSVKNEFKTEYLIQILSKYINNHKLSFSSFYQILLATITDKNINFSFFTLYSIVQILFNEKKYTLNFNSNYSVNLSENYNKSLIFSTSYTITNI